MLYSYGHIQHDTRNERHKVPKQIGDNQCVHTALELRAVPPQLNCLIFRKKSIPESKKNTGTAIRARTCDSPIATTLNKPSAEKRGKSASFKGITCGFTCIITTATAIGKRKKSMVADCSFARSSEASLTESIVSVLFIVD